MGKVIALHEHHVIIGNDFWVDAATGNWEVDCLAGRARADLFADNLTDRHEIHAYYMRSMRTMVERGQFSGVEVGFFQRLLELATQPNRDKDARTQCLAPDQ